MLDKTYADFRARVVSRYMRDRIAIMPGYFDTHNCGGVDMTKLAVDAAQEFDLYDGDEVREWVFEVALEVAVEHGNQTS